MSVGTNICKLRKERGIKQQEIAELINMHRSNYSKIENGQREISVAALDKIAHFFGLTMDQIVHMNGSIPDEVHLSDKSDLEQMKLIQELNEEDKAIIFKMIETILTKEKFQTFFKENIPQ